MAARNDTNPIRPRWGLWKRWVLGTVTVIGGIGVALLVAAFGHCSAFGGRCPAEPEPLLQDDVFGSVAVTIAITVWVVGLCIRPNRRGAVAGFLAALPIGVLAGLAVSASGAG